MLGGPKPWEHSLKSYSLALTLLWYCPAYQHPAVLLSVGIGVEREGKEWILLLLTFWCSLSCYLKNTPWNPAFSKKMNKRDMVSNATFPNRPVSLGISSFNSPLGTNYFLFFFFFPSYTHVGKQGNKLKLFFCQSSEIILSHTP